MVYHKKSEKIPYTHFEYIFTLYSYFIFTSQRKQRLRWTSKLLFFPLMKTSCKFLPVQLILKYTARAHTHTHTYIQDGFLSLNSFNKFPWGTNAESWSWKRLVAGIHRKTRQWVKLVLRESLISK